MDLASLFPSTSQGSQEKIVATYLQTVYPLPPNGDYTQEVVLPGFFQQLRRHFNRDISNHSNTCLTIMKVSNLQHNYSRYVTLSTIQSEISDCLLPNWILKGLRIEEGDKIKLDLIAKDFYIAPIQSVRLKPMAFTNDLLSFSMRNGPMFQRKMRDWIKNFHLIQIGDNLPFYVPTNSTFRVVEMQPNHQVGFNTKNIREIVKSSGEDFTFEIIFDIQ